MKQRIVLLLLLVAVICLCTTGCAKVRYQVYADKPVLLGGIPDRAYDTTRRIEDEGRKWWLLWWIIPTGDGREDAFRDLANSGGDAVVNVSIHEYYGVVDWLIQNWSLIIGIPGITNTLREDFEADVVRFR